MGGVAWGGPLPMLSVPNTPPPLPAAAGEGCRHDMFCLA